MKKMFSIKNIAVVMLCAITMIVSACGERKPVEEWYEYKDVKKAYDTWFYCWTEKYKGRDIHISYRIKSVNFKPSANISGNLEMYGLFMIGRGQIDSTDYYYVYQEVDPDIYKLVKIPADETSILETDEISPSIGAEYDFEFNLNLYYDWKHGKYSFAKNNLIIVPKGTVIQEFNVQNVK